MEVQSPHMYTIIMNNQGLQYEHDQLETQMQNLEPGSPEYIYDQLQLEREERELEIRKEHPNLDPTTLDGEQALDQIMTHDPGYQAINLEISAFIKAHRSEASSWGIPSGDPRFTKCVKID